MQVKQLKDIVSLLYLLPLDSLLSTTTYQQTINFIKLKARVRKGVSAVEQKHHNAH